MINLRYLLVLLCCLSWTLVAQAEDGTTAAQPMAAATAQTTPAMAQVDNAQPVPMPTTTNSTSSNQQQVYVQSVDDGSQAGNQAVNTASTVTNADQANNNNLTLADRITRLEAQVTYLQRALSNRQISQLQTQLQSLQGQLDMQAHQLHIIQAKQQNLFAMLDRKTMVTANDKNATASTAAKPVYNKNMQNMGVIGNSDDGLKEQDMYENAYHFIKKRQYTLAAQGMQDYLKAYPQGKFVPNAYYWLGELYLISGKSQQAFTAFQTITTKFPKSNKAADANLKLGSLYQEQQQWAKARQAYTLVVKQYGGSAAAKIAGDKLRQLGMAGR